MVRPERAVRPVQQAWDTGPPSRWVDESRCRAGDTGRHDEDGDAVGLFVVRVFGPDAEIAKVPSVIAPQDDDGVLLEAQSLQRGGHATDLRIDVSRAGVVAVDQLPRQRLAYLPVHRHGCVRGNFPARFRPPPGRPWERS